MTMRNSFRSVILFASSALVLGAIGGCSKPSDFKVPDLDKIKVRIGHGGGDPWLRASQGGTCDLAAGDLTVTAEAVANLMVVKDRVESQRRKMIDCDGVEVSDKPEPVRSLVRKVDVSAPTSGAAVSAVEILNERTCTIVRVQKTAATGDAAGYLNEIEENGKLKLSLTDDFDLHASGAVLVKDGENPIEIRYLGADGAVVSTRQMLIRVLVDRPVIEGENQPQRIPQCQ